jgi:predicted CopG family antitoxin
MRLSLTSEATGLARDGIVDRLDAMRGQGESYSDVILRLVEIEAKGGD